jgi:U3 small nucleolar RNA-associated protein 10
LTRSTHLADGPFEAIVEALLTPDTGADVSQRLLTLLVVLNDRKGWQGGLGEDASDRLAGIHELGGMLVASMEKYDFTNALSVILDELIAQ